MASNTHQRKQFKMKTLDQAVQISRLIEQDWDFADSTTSDHRYKLHPYPARFIPEIPRELIKSMGIPEGTAVLDPFSGSGTTAIEAQRLGYPAYGIDLNPIATLISSVLARGPYLGLLDRANQMVSEAKSQSAYERPDIPNLDHWFKGRFIKSISSLIVQIDKLADEETRNALRFALSANLVKASNQDSDTRYAAVDKSYTVQHFHHDFLRTCKQLEELLSLGGTEPCQFFTQDSRTFSYESLEREVGLVITSPPYPNAYEYWLYHKYRMWWLGFDPLAVKEAEIGARPKYYKKNPETPEDFTANISSIVEGINTRLHRDGSLCWVVGSSFIHGEEIDNATLITEAHERHGLQLQCRIGRSIRLGRKSFNLSNSRQTKEEILVFRQRRLSPRATYRLYYHPYQYFPYEKKLAKREILNLGKIACFVEKEDSVEVSFSKKNGTHPEHLVYFSAVSNGKSPMRPTQQALLERAAAKGNRQATRYSVHGLHEYKGKFNPQIVRGILNTLGFRNGEKVLDPFCGSGTTLVECALEGRHSFGTDINPLAVFLANTKVQTLSLDPDDIDHAFGKLIDHLKDSVVPESQNSEREQYLQKWFLPEYFRFIESARVSATTLDEKCKNLVLALLSDMLREYSEQEPADLRIRRRKSPYPNKPILENLEYRMMQFSSLYRKSFEVVGKIESPNCAHCLSNSTPIGLRDLIDKVGLFDGIVSSPPYATALPYIDTQRLSLVWLSLLGPSELLKKEAELTGSRELNKKALDENNAMILQNYDELPESAVGLCGDLLNRLGVNDGFRRKATPALLYRYFVAMKSSLLSNWDALKKGGKLCYLLGTNQTTIAGNKTVIETPQLISDIGESLGYTIQKPIDLEVYKRYGMHSKNAVKNEQLILLEKP
mgnify:CR=1 FL=1